MCRRGGRIFLEGRKGLQHHLSREEKRKRCTQVLKKRRDNKGGGGHRCITWGKRGGIPPLMGISLKEKWGESLAAI